MGSRTVCPLCSRIIKSNQLSIECSGCVSWIHRGCSMLSSSDFDKICAQWKKQGSHNWECSVCKKTVNKRLSIGIVGDLTPAAGSTSRTTSPVDPLSAKRSSDVAGHYPKTHEHAIREQIADLSKKSNVSNRDIFSVMSGMINILFEQSSDFKSEINELRNELKLREDRIVRLESEVSELRDSVQSLGINQPDNPNLVVAGSANSQQSDEAFNELQDRCARSRNILMYNIFESKSTNTRERIDHDKAHVTGVFEKLDFETPPDFKVVRIGQSGEKPRPLKIIFSDESMARKCLYNKSRLRGDSIQIKADLTVMQRRQLKSVYDQLNERKLNGESDIVVRFRNGNPFIAKQRAYNRGQPKND